MDVFLNILKWKVLLYKETTPKPLNDSRNAAKKITDNGLFLLRVFINIHKTPYSAYQCHDGNKAKEY